MVGAQADQAQTVLNAMRDALGGEQKINALKSLSAEGTYRRTMGEREMSGDFEWSLQFPEQVSARRTVHAARPACPARASFARYNGTEGWIDAPRAASAWAAGRR